MISCSTTSNNCLLTWWVDTTEVPSTHIRIFFNPQLCNFFCVYGLSPNVSGESGIRIRNFLNPLSNVHFFNTLWNRNCLGAKSGHFYPVTKQDWAQFFTVNTQFKMATSTHALLLIFPKKSWVLEWIHIRVGYVWTGKFDSNTDTCGRGNFWVQG